MSTQADRRHAAKLHYLARGRADGLVDLADLLGWSEGKTYAMGRQIGLVAGDVREAIQRANAYRETDA